MSVRTQRSSDFLDGMAAAYAGAAARTAGTPSHAYNAERAAHYAALRAEPARVAEQLTLNLTPPRTAGFYTCTRCNTVTTLGVPFCPTHGWYPDWRPARREGAR